MKTTDVTRHRQERNFLHRSWPESLLLDFPNRQAFLQLLGFLGFSWSLGLSTTAGSSAKPRQDHPVNPRDPSMTTPRLVGHPVNSVGQGLQTVCACGAGINVDLTALWALPLFLHSQTKSVAVHAHSKTTPSSAFVSSMIDLSRPEQTHLLRRDLLHNPRSMLARRILDCSVPMIQ